MNILVAVDLSPASAKVIEAARGVADLTGASIYVLHVVESEPDFIGYDADPEDLRARTAADFPLEYQGVLALTKKLQDEGLDAIDWLVRGPAVETTLKLADKLNVGLFIVGTHGHGSVYDVLIGSYSAEIIRKTKLPVLVVPILEF